MDKWICMNCESENSGNGDFCAFCGAKRVTGSDVNREQTVPVPPVETWKQGAQEQSSQYRYTNAAADRPADGFRETRADSRTESNGDALRALIRKYDLLKIIYKALIVFFTIVLLALFAVPYINGYNQYTVYNNCGGKNGPIEQICSIVLVCITIAPAVFACIPLNARRRNLPITITVIVAILTTIYCASILFTSIELNAVLVLVILAAWACVVFAVLMVKTLNRLDNAMYRPIGF